MGAERLPQITLPKNPQDAGFLIAAKGRAGLGCSMNTGFPWFWRSEMFVHTYMQKHPWFWWRSTIYAIICDFLWNFFSQNHVQAKSTDARTGHRSIFRTQLSAKGSSSHHLTHICINIPDSGGVPPKSGMFWISCGILSEPIWPELLVWTSCVVAKATDGIYAVAIHTVITAAKSRFLNIAFFTSSLPSVIMSKLSWYLRK